jgi:hypothetical protein
MLKVDISVRLISGYHRDHREDKYEFFKKKKNNKTTQWHTQKFFSGGVQQIQLRTERTGIGGGNPSQGFRPICKWVKPVFLLGS